MTYLARFIFWIFGWKYVGNSEDLPPKAVMIQAPHTSAWDFPIGRLALFTGGIRVKTMIKKESFFFPQGLFLRLLGAFPVNRASSQRSIKYVASLFDKKKKFILLMTPEGTRKLNKRWKKGFYFVAQKAEVPIVFGYLCYKKREAGLGPVFYPTGDYEEDMKIIEAFYQDKVAKYPEKFNLSPMHRQKEDL